MTHVIPSRPRFRLQGWHVLIMFVVFFGVDIGVNTVFMVSAYKTFPGETSITPYEDGLAYNAELRARRAQSALGWRFDAGADGTGGLRIDAFDRSGAPLRGLNVVARLRRPATDDGARVANFAETAPGIYLARGQHLAGAWDLALTARDAGGRTATAERRLYQP